MCGFEIGFSTIIYINAPAINGIGNIWLDGFAAMDPRVLQNHDDTQMSCGAKAFDQFDGSANWVMTPNVSLPAIIRVFFVSDGKTTASESANLWPRAAITSYVPR